MYDPVDVSNGALLWTPSPARVANAQVSDFARWLEAEGLGPGTAHFPDLWRWSVEDLDGFWEALRRWAGVSWMTPASAVLARDRLPGATWFPGATLNYAAAALRHPPSRIAVVLVDEEGTTQLTYGELSELVRRCAAGFRRLGVGRGDRVAAYLPNRLEALAAFLATASIGAIWTACSPDFGGQSVLDRFSQVEPLVLLLAPGYRYGGQWFDRRDTARELARGLPSVQSTVTVGEGDSGWLRWDELLKADDDPLEFEPVPFDHPLWVVYTSGTTGLPKSIVHGHGGVVLEHHKLLRLHLDLTPDDRFFWFTTTGWVMWNIVVGALLVGASAVLYDGHPGHPGPGRLWQVAAESEATFAGVSAGYVHASLRAGLQPANDNDLDRIRGVGVTGSPLSAAGNAWLYQAIDPELFVASISGGTDVCTAFVGSTPVLPTRAGHLQHACLGVDAAAYDDTGRPVVGEVGELVVTRPMPSMPVAFWGPDGDGRYRSSYFEHFPGVWRHGDWVLFESDGSCRVLGRSDATLNRGGVRMGSSEFYAVLDTVESITDSLVIDTTAAGHETGQLVLLVVPAPGVDVDARAVDDLRSALRRALSPRHVPDCVLAVPALPHTLNGKRLEVPVRRLFLGTAPSDALDRSAVDDPAALDHLIAVIEAWRAGP